MPGRALHSGIGVPYFFLFFFVFFATFVVETGASADTFNIRDHGAKGDGTANDAAAIQRAIDACSAAGGGTVQVPPGEYRSGTLQLKSFVTLRLEAGANLHASPDEEDFSDRACLLWADRAERIAIEGHGVFHGRGDADLGRRPGVAYEPRPEFRTQLMVFDDCQFVTVRDITLRNSDSWALHLFRCENVVIDGIELLNNYFRTNSDGIDPDSCKNVRISNCHIVAGDDCICLKASDEKPCENVVVTNCVVESGATAIKLGTASTGDFRDIVISNCVVRNSTVGIGFFVKDGGAIERVTCSNIVIETLEDPALVNTERLRNMIYPIFIDLERRRAPVPLGAIRDVLFDNIQIYSDNAVLIQGMEERPIENLTLRNVLFRASRFFDFSAKEKHAGGDSNPDDDRITRFARKPSYLTLAHIDGLTLDNVRVAVAEDAAGRADRSALYLEDIRGADLRGIHRKPANSAGTLPVIQAHNVRDMLLSGSRALKGEPAFLGISGPLSADIRLTGNALDAANIPVLRAGDVAEHAIRESAVE